MCIQGVFQVTCAVAPSSDLCNAAANLMLVRKGLMFGVRARNFLCHSSNLNVRQAARHTNTSGNAKPQSFHT